MKFEYSLCYNSPGRVYFLFFFFTFFTGIMPQVFEYFHVLESQIQLIMFVIFVFDNERPVCDA